MRLLPVLVLPLAVSCATAPASAPVDAQPGPPAVLLDATAVFAGESFTLTVTGLSPNKTAYFFASVAGAGAGPCYLGGALCLDVVNPRRLGSAAADGTGTATLTKALPAGFGAASLTFQAAANDGGAVVTPTVVRVVGDGDLDDLAGEDDCVDDNPLVTGPCCRTWEAVYDLTGSTFFIDALQDFTITLQTPYTDPLNMGPGSLTLSFPDDSGAPGDGDVLMTYFYLDQNFTTGIPGLADVTTDIVNDAGPDALGVAFGSLVGSTLSWSPSTIDPVCRNGTVSCVGPFCGSFGAPPEGAPFVFTDECGPYPVSTFTFAAGGTETFAASVIVDSTADQTTSITLAGTRTSLTEVVGDAPCP